MAYVGRRTSPSVDEKPLRPCKDMQRSENAPVRLVWPLLVSMSPSCTAGFLLFNQIIMIMKITGTDRIEEIVTYASSALAEECLVQNGMEDSVYDHDDDWYKLQEYIREEILKCICNIPNLDEL